MPDDAGADVLPMALDLVRGATAEAVPLRLIGGLAVRVLCPAFPPRVRARQDLDLASVSSARARLTDFLVQRGHEPDKRFNALYLLSACEVRPGDEVGAIGLDRITRIVGDDWGWWRTVTLNLARIQDLAIAENPRLVPPGGAHEPVEQIERISRAVDEAPKSLRWKIRARVGERKRWYTLPDEDSHD